MEWQAWLAGILFLVVYGMIIWDKYHRTPIALVGAAVLLLAGVLNQEQALGFIDFNTIGLLTGMMIIVGIMRQSGVFEYLSIKAAKKAGGDPIKILIFLAIITALASALLDNVTTVLLIVPVTFAICSRLDVTPIPFLIAEIFASNIGGTSTLIGDPPNIMIGSATGLGMMDFIVNLAPVIVVILAVTIALLVLIYRKSLVVEDANRERIYEFNENEMITDMVLLKKSLLVMTFVIIGFFLHQVVHLESATIAMAGAGILLLISGVDTEEVMETVEWTTLFFFIGLFILVGGLVQVGIIEAVAVKIIELTQGNLTLTAMLILWFSAIASAFVDNIPFVATFIPLIKDIGTLGGMPVDNLWWALSLGACLGGNGTLIGASANVIVSGLAGRHGHPISFAGYMKVAMPLMLVSIVISMIYLLLFYF
ncbi:MAG: SLC13 family permease [Methylocystaceae bacterium]